MRPATVAPRRAGINRGRTGQARSGAHPPSRRGSRRTASRNRGCGPFLRRRQARLDAPGGCGRFRCCRGIDGGPCLGVVARDGLPLTSRSRPEIPASAGLGGFPSGGLSDTLSGMITPCWGVVVNVLPVTAPWCYREPLPFVATACVCPAGITVALENCERWAGIRAFAVK